MDYVEYKNITTYPFLILYIIHSADILIYYWIHTCDCMFFILGIHYISLILFS